MNRKDHPTETEILAFVIGTDDAGAQENVRAHVAECEACTRWATELTCVAGAMKTREVSVPPRDVVDRVIGLFRERVRPRGRRPLEMIPKILADLLFDSTVQPALAGARSGRVMERQLLYSVAGFDIDVRLRPRVKGSAYSLVGQILPEGDEFLDPDRLQVYLEGSKGSITSLAVTRFGEFMAWEIDEGSQTIELIVGDQICYQFSFVV